MFRKSNTPFWTDSTYEKELMAEFLFTGNAVRKEEMDYHGKFGHTIGWIQNIAIMRIIEIFYTAYYMGTQTVAHALPGLQYIKICIQYLASHPHKPIFYPSTYYYGSNSIRLIWIGTQVKYYTTQNFLGCHQDADCYIIINRRRPVSGILYCYWNFSPL